MIPDTYDDVTGKEICEHVQRGLASRVYDRGRVSVKFEAGVHWFQRRLGEAPSGSSNRGR